MPPPSAATSAREILTGLHEVMAKRGSAQTKLDRVVDLIADAMKSDVCSIYLLRDNYLELFATHGLRKEAVHVTRLRMGEGLVGTIAAEGRILNLAEAAEHPAFAYRPEGRHLARQRRKRRLRDRICRPRHRMNGVARDRGDVDDRSPALVERRGKPSREA